MDPLLLVLAIAAAGSAIAALFLPSERGRTPKFDSDETLRDQLAAWR